MKDRIKEIRIASKKNQTDFAKSISVSRSAICKMESGENSPSEQTISLICRTFNVNEDWLRYGKGEMFLEKTIDEEIATFIGKIQMDDKNNFKKRFIAMLSKLDESEWEFLEQKAREIVGYDKKMD